MTTAERPTIGAAFPRDFLENLWLAQAIVGQPDGSESDVPGDCGEKRFLASPKALEALSVVASVSSLLPLPSIILQLFNCKLPSTLLRQLSGEHNFDQQTFFSFFEQSAHEKLSPLVVSAAEEEDDETAVYVRGSDSIPFGHFDDIDDESVGGATLSEQEIPEPVDEGSLSPKDNDIASTNDPADNAEETEKEILLSKSETEDEEKPSSGSWVKPSRTDRSLFSLIHSFRFFKR